MVTAFKDMVATAELQSHTGSSVSTGFELEEKKQSEKDAEN